MKTSYKLIAYVVYIIQISIFSKKINEFHLFDLPFDSKDFLYLMFAGTIVLFVLFQFDKYNQYLKEHGAFLVIRYKKLRHLYDKFIKECFIQAILLTLIKVIIEIIIFRKILFLNEFIFLSVVFLILMIHCALEIHINSKISLLIIVMYLGISLSIGDMFNQSAYFFVLNLVFPSRVENTILSLIGINVLNIIIYCVSVCLLKKKEIY